MIQETAIAPVTSAAFLAFRALACGPTRPFSIERGERAEMPHRACPVGAGQESGAVGLNRLSQLLVRVHDAVRLAQGRTARYGVGQDLRCHVRQVHDIGVFRQVRRHSGQSNHDGRMQRRVPHDQLCEDRWIPGRQRTATAGSDFPSSGGVGQEHSAVGSPGSRRLLV